MKGSFRRCCKEAFSWGMWQLRFTPEGPRRRWEPLCARSWWGPTTISAPAWCRAPPPRTTGTTPETRAVHMGRDAVYLRTAP